MSRETGEESEPTSSPSTFHNRTCSPSYVEKRAMQSGYFDFNHKNSEFQGSLSKWTNYVLGWKSRFFVLNRGSLLYYKSEEDRQFGCRGAINLSEAVVVAHNLDECRFDVYISDLTWYLRSESLNDRQKWLDALKPSTKNTIIDSQLPEWQNCCLSLEEKKQRIISYRDVLCRQLHDIEDVLANQYPLEKKNVAAETSKDAPTTVVDSQVQVVTFKTTTSAIIKEISDCIGVLEKERYVMENPEKNSEENGISSDETHKESEGTSKVLLKEVEQFYDAVDSGSRVSLLKDAALVEREPNEPEIVEHALWNEILAVSNEQIQTICMDTNDGLWSSLVDDGQMKIYTRELEVDGLVVDPLKACYTVKGATGHEMCHYFFDPQYRQDWENGLESVEVVEQISPSALIMHQIYKRIWPAAQRDLLFWSYLTHGSNPKAKGGPDVWCVVNKSVDLPQLPTNEGQLVRVALSACLYCVTEISQGANEVVARDDITCHLTYCSVVNPGGWVPAAAVRALRRKEYPKFLTKFTSYVLEQTRHKDILM